jgi:hypothetical protein
MAHRLAGAAAAILGAALGLPATGQPTFSIDYHGAPKGIAGACLPPVPITEGDILMPPGPLFTPAPALGPPFPCIARSAGFGPPVPGLGLPAAPGAVGLPAGIPGMVEVDAISYGTDLPLTPGMTALEVMWVFSVDEWAMGNPAMPLVPNVASLSPPLGAPTNVAAAVFRDLTLGPGPACALLVPPGGNTILFDGNGLAPPFPPVAGVGLVEPTFAVPGLPDAGSNLDALDVDTPTGPAGLPPATTIYFSLDSGPAVFDPLEVVPGSGSAAANGFVSGANVMVSLPGAPGAIIYAPAFLLGLDLAGIDTDDLDALVVWENGTGVFEPPAAPFSWVGGATDMLFFSVRRGSAVVGVPASGPGGCVGLPISPGDILWPPAAPGLPPRIWITAEQLGLMTVRSGFPVDDDLDALDVTRDCNGNLMVDAIEVATGTAADCDGNGIPDACDIAAGTVPDCNGNGVPDACDIASGASADINLDGIPDTCSCPADWNADGAFTPADIAEFIASWLASLAAGTLAADYNGDGAVTTADVAAFVSSWFAALAGGC